METANQENAASQQNVAEQKDPFEEIIDILNGYEEGCRKTTLQEHRCTCGGPHGRK
ncbi:hypothetical protein HYS48_00915 [Candidatus Woesearchaeota archaeon]|nr:hypothetical protein [Candidatus Woesearchaeota archaeon]